LLSLCSSVPHHVGTPWPLMHPKMHSVGSKAGCNRLCRVGRTHPCWHDARVLWHECTLDSSYFSEALETAVVPESASGGVSRAGITSAPHNQGNLVPPPVLDHRRRPGKGGKEEYSQTSWARSEMARCMCCTIAASTPKLTTFVGNATLISLQLTRLPLLTSEAVPEIAPCRVSIAGLVTVARGLNTRKY
jgi:hypothetical protein